MRSQLGLVAPSARACSPVPRVPRVSGLSYVRGAVANPVCLAIAMFAGCIGLGYAGVLGSTLAVIAVLVLGASTARSHAVRSYVDDQAVARARAHRECQRQKRLRPTGGTRQQHYTELRLLVEEGERPG